MRIWMALVGCLAMTFAACSSGGTERDASGDLGPWIAPQGESSDADPAARPGSAGSSTGGDPITVDAGDAPTGDVRADTTDREGSTATSTPDRAGTVSDGPCPGWYRYVADDDFDALRTVIDALDADGHADEADAAADIVRRRGDASLAQIDAVRDILVTEYDCDPARS